MSVAVSFPPHLVDGGLNLQCLILEVNRCLFQVAQRQLQHCLLRSAHGGCSLPLFGLQWHRSWGYTHLSTCSPRAEGMKVGVHLSMPHMTMHSRFPFSPSPLPWLPPAAPAPQPSSLLQPPSATVTWQPDVPGWPHSSRHPWGEGGSQGAGGSGINVGGNMEEIQGGAPLATATGFICSLHCIIA